MNALLWTPSPNDDAVLWLCVKHPPQTNGSIARVLGKSTAVVSQTLSRLRAHNLLEPVRASTIPLPAGLERARWLERRHYPGTFVEPDPVPETARSSALAMEPRGSIALPPPDALIDALAGFQDELLQRANAQLRLEVTELRAERDALRARCERCLLLLAQAADAITG